MRKLSAGLEGGTIMKNKTTAQTMQAIEFRRADPEALARFDPNTKRCTMNCGPHVQDMRTREERMFFCDDCETIAHSNVRRNRRICSEHGERKVCPS